MPQKLLVVKCYDSGGGELDGRVEGGVEEEVEVKVEEDNKRERKKHNQGVVFFL